MTKTIIARKRSKNRLGPLIACIGSREPYIEREASWETWESLREARPFHSSHTRGSKGEEVSLKLLLDQDGGTRGHPKESREEKKREELNVGSRRRDIKGEKQALR